MSSTVRSKPNFASCEIHRSRVSYVSREGPLAGDSPGYYQGQRDDNAYRQARFPDDVDIYPSVYT